MDPGYKFIDAHVSFIYSLRKTSLSIHLFSITSCPVH